jgi:hypothetical protein
VIWFRATFAELRIIVRTVPILCDSSCARSIIEDLEKHKRTNHIAMKYFFFRDQQELKNLIMTTVKTENQIDDIFTKPLVRKRFEMLRQVLGNKTKIFDRKVCMNSFLSLLYIMYGCV